MRPVLAVPVLVAATFAVACRGGPPAGTDRPSPYAVGFRTSWATDPERAYATRFDGGATYGGRAGGAPRPVLVNEWYPAAPETDEAPMPYAGYFAIGAEDAALDRFARALAAHARAVLVEEVLGVPEEELDELGRELLGELLASPTACRRDAPRAPGPFPVVLYHSGAGSSYEDNARLCEVLAGRGYVVIGSAFPAGSGETLSVDAGADSARDFAFLARLAAELPEADGARVALVGHSLGAQAILRHAAGPGCVGDALVLLDSTLDYYGTTMPLHRELVEEVAAGARHLTQPMLLAAGPDAMFELADSLAGAERIYLTMPDLGHNEFIAQGLQRCDLACARQAREPGAQPPAEVGRAPGVRSRYAQLGELVVAFLDAHLKGERGALEALTSGYARTPLGAEPHVELAARGATGPEPYDPGSSSPPTPRQLGTLVAASGAEPAAAVLRRVRAEHPESPLLSSNMLLGSLLHRLAADGRLEDARTLYVAVKEVRPGVLSVFTFLADLAVLLDRRRDALEVLRIAALLDPDDEAVSARLRDLAGEPSE